MITEYHIDELYPGINDLNFFDEQSEEEMSYQAVKVKSLQDLVDIFFMRLGWN